MPFWSRTRFIMAAPGVNPLEEPLAEPARNRQRMYIIGFVVLVLIACITSAILYLTQPKEASALAVTPSPSATITTTPTQTATVTRTPTLTVTPTLTSSPTISVTNTLAATSTPVKQTVVVTKLAWYPVTQIVVQEREVTRIATQIATVLVTQPSQTPWVITVQVPVTVIPVQPTIELSATPTLTSSPTPTQTVTITATISP